MIPKFQPAATLIRIKDRLLRSPKQYSLYTDQARNTSTLVIGQPGTGKSKFLESLILQDIKNNKGVAVIDVHGDLYQSILTRLAVLALRSPDLANRVVIIDPTKPEASMNINPLEAIKGQSQERTALFMTDIVIKIWQISPNESPRLVWLLTNTFLALADLELSLADFARWLQDRQWRDEHAEKIKNEAVRRYWMNEFPRSDKEAQVWMAPATNKLGGILFDPEVRQMLTGNNQVTMRDIMDQGLVLLVHIPKGLLGEQSAYLLAAFIVAQIQKAALSRADELDRTLFILYLDEFQNYTTKYIQDVLAESRKYKLSLVLAHQFLDQLSREMSSAVLNTTGTIVSFRIGYKDARAIVHEIFPRPDFPLFAGDTEKASWEKLALELANLPPRTFWVRRRGPYQPAKKRTLDVNDIEMTPALEQAIQRFVEASGNRYSGVSRSRRSLPSTQLQVTSPNASVQGTYKPVDVVENSEQHDQQGNENESANPYSDIVWDE